MTMHSSENLLVKKSEKRGRKYKCIADYALKSRTLLIIIMSRVEKIIVAPGILGCYVFSSVKKI